MSDLDEKFFDRADEHIKLANSQLTAGLESGRVSASMMYATARFNAWISATGWRSGEESKAARDETIEFFISEYRIMLEENLDAYIENFDDYMQRDD